MRPAHRLADRFRIRGIVLVGLHVGLHKVRRKQAQRVSMALERPRPVVRTRAGFHANHTRRQVYEHPAHLAAVDLTAQYDLAVLIHTVQLKNALCQIDANGCNSHGGRSHPR